MAGDPDAELRAWVAGSQDIPPEVRDRLAEDPGHRVQITSGHWTPPGLVAHLVGDPHPSVRTGVAKSRWALPAVLERLAEDPEPEVDGLWRALRGTGRFRST